MHDWLFHSSFHPFLFIMFVLYVLHSILLRLQFSFPFLVSISKTIFPSLQTNPLCISPIFPLSSLSPSHYPWFHFTALAPPSFHQTFHFPRSFPISLIHSSWFHQSSFSNPDKSVYPNSYSYHSIPPCYPISQTYFFLFIYFPCSVIQVLLNPFPSISLNNPIPFISCHRKSSNQVLLFPSVIILHTIFV